MGRGLILPPGIKRFAEKVFGRFHTGHLSRRPQVAQDLIAADYIVGAAAGSSKSKGQRAAHAASERCAPVAYCVRGSNVQFAFVFAAAMTYACAEVNMGTTATASLSNRRRSQRRKARTSVKVQCRKGAYGFGANLASSLLDLSDSGVRLIITQQLDAMAEVEVILNGYGMKEAIKRLGNIRWQVQLESGQFCVGVAFQKSLAYRDWQNLVSPN